MKIEPKEQTIARRFCPQCFAKPIGMTEDGAHFIMKGCQNPDHKESDVSL